MALSKKHKAFRFAKIIPIDANNINLEQAFARFLVLIRTKGLPITSTTKKTLYPDSLIEVIAEDREHFQGISNESQRKRLLEHWISNDFTTCIREGRGHAGKPRIANLKPIHLSTIKLLDPRIKSQDRDLSVFFYNLFKDTGVIIGQDSLLLPYLTRSTIDFGDYDTQINETKARDLDIETLFLLRLLEHFKTDRPDRNRRVFNHDFICPAQKQLIINDTVRLLVYGDIIPRREIIQYLMTLLSFHAALYCIKSFSIVTVIAEQKKFRCDKCKGINNNSLDDLYMCTYHPDIFVDLTNGQNDKCDELAKEKLAKHYAIMYRYFRSHYKLKKLDEFASTFPGYSGSIEELVGFMNHEDLKGYFRSKLSEVTSTEEGEEQDPEIESIRNLGLDPFETYVEILYQKTYKTRVQNHKKLMASLCGLNREDGFLQGGRGKKRKYVLGNQLLEVLLQLAVVSYNKNRGFYTKPIRITDFVEWLYNRYGILIDRYNEPYKHMQVASALESNYIALKDRLRQLGFYTDLSDASISQAIKPRFYIESLHIRPGEK